MIAPARQESALPHEPCKKPLNQPSSAIEANLSSILRHMLLKPIPPMRGYHLDTFRKCFIKGVARVTP